MAKVVAVVAIVAVDRQKLCQDRCNTVVHMVGSVLSVEIVGARASARMEKGVIDVDLVEVIAFVLMAGSEHNVKNAVARFAGMAVFLVAAKIVVHEVENHNCGRYPHQLRASCV